MTSGDGKIGDNESGEDDGEGTKDDGEGTEDDHEGSGDDVEMEVEEDSMIPRVVVRGDKQVCHVIHVLSLLLIVALALSLTRNTCLLGQPYTVL